MIRFYLNFIKKNYIVVVLLILVLNLFGIEYLKYEAVIFITVTYIIFMQKPVKYIDYNLLLLVIFSALYIYFLQLYSFRRFGIIDTFFSVGWPVSFYIWGKYVYSVNKNEINLTKIFILFIIIFSFIPLLSNLIDIVLHGFMHGRSVHLIGSGLDFSTATGLASFFSLNAVLFPFLLLSFKKKEERTIKKVAAIIFFEGLVCAANLQTRTSFILMGISALAVIGILNRDKVSDYIFKLFITSLGVLILVFAFFSWFQGSALYGRFFVEDSQTGLLSARSNIWSDAIDVLIRFPMGGSERLIAANYAHNMWLDVGYKTGLIVLFILLIITFRYLFIVWTLLFKRKLSLILKIMILCISIGFLGTFMVEPIMEGAFLLFCLFCFFWGIFYSLKTNKFYKNYNPDSSSVQVKANA